MIDDNEDKLKKARLKQYKDTIEEIKQEVIKKNTERSLENLKLLKEAITKDLKEKPKKEPKKEEPKKEEPKKEEPKRQNRPPPNSLAQLMRFANIDADMK
jgi:hypothetical protein